jgi:plasmid stability protein
MDAKLTLKLDKNVIEKAKIYAAEHKHSLSLLVENYLKAITETEKKENAKEIEISSFVKSLAVGKGEVSVDFDYKKDRQDYLSQKYK